MSSNSDPRNSPPGQQPSEVPHQLKNDEFVTFFWGAAMLLFPPIWAEGDKPLHRRFWAWRYIYLSFILLSAAVFHEPLLAGNLMTAALFPFAHVLAPLSLAGGMVGFRVPGLSLPMVDYTIAAGLYVTGIAATFGADVLRRTKPNMFALNPWDADDDETVVPLETVERKGDHAESPPTLEKDVSTLVTGETGAGKTSMIQTLAYQFPYERNTAVIAYDTSEEYQQFYADLGFDVKRINATDSDVTWNLFKDADSRADFREVAAAIFGDPIGEDPFHRPAKQIFEDMLMYLHLEAKRNNRRDELSHVDIVSLLEKGQYALKEALDEYDRLESDYIDPDGGKGAMNVYIALKENVRPIFVDGFASHGDFSIQEYIENPDGRVLIIDASMTRKETLAPMHKLLIDWSIRYAMEAPNPTVHVLDEIDSLPPLNQVRNLAARGRKYKSRTIIGVQTLGQLEEKYGSSSIITGNCPQGVHLGPGGSESNEFVRDEIGERRELDRHETVSLSREGRNNPARTQSRDTYKYIEKCPLISGDLTDFDTGDCVVISRSTWWQGNAHQLHEVRDNLPEMGAESPTTQRVEDDQTEDGLEDHESWRALARAKIGGLRSDDDEGTTESQTETETETVEETDTEPAVWAAETDSEPDRRYTEGIWDQTLDRLDIQNPPVTEKDNLDAMQDIGAMLDQRVIKLPGTMMEVEIRELLAEIVIYTGLTKAQTLELVSEYTEILEMNEEFQDQFTDDWDQFNLPAQDATDDPLAQTTENTAVRSPVTDDETGESPDQEQTQSSEEEPAPSPDADVDEEQYTLDGLEDALPDDSESADDDEESSPPEDDEQSTTKESNSDEGEPETDNYDPEDFW